MKVTAIALLSLFAALNLAAADALHFEVASIHPSPDNATLFARPPSGGQFNATAVVARFVVMVAWNVQESQIAGGPSWFSTDRWNIDAKSTAGATYTAEESRQMLQNLLQDRFGLRMHRETRDLPSYVLKISKNGPKLKADDTGATNVRVSGNSIGLERGEISRLVQLLSSALGKPVVDQTGLAGHYDLLLQWNDAPVADGGVMGLNTHATSDPNRESIFSAIQDQLGLQLVSQHQSVEMIVIDKINRPSPN
ncbi:MAG TPA: TIGR03435 family protein [Bryobacteraceae bacterium]|nr:TIGR03435 family protein [Bryobacteraceae bacterium]